MSLGRHIWRALLVACLLFGGLLMVSDYSVRRGSAGRTYSDAAAVPHRAVGVLLGCAKRVPGGGDSPFFIYRVQAAAELWRNGKIDYVLVSGDNHASDYNEPIELRAALIEAKVPAERIYLDYAGFRTLDSVVRAKDVFGQQQITIISQRFHNQRAIYIAQHHGIDAIGFNAKDVALQYSFVTLVRERFARTKTILDMTFGKRPHFLGPSIRIGIDPPTAAPSSGAAVSRSQGAKIEVSDES